MTDKREVVVNDKMQSGYRYTVSQPVSGNFADDFTPAKTPLEMLEMGVFEGRYINDCTDEFPADWFRNAKTSTVPDANLNYFGVKSRQPLSVWRRKGWIYGPDPRGWFQWYCRYYMGRRLEDIDRIQIGRWKGFVRHAGQESRDQDRDVPLAFLRRFCAAAWSRETPSNSCFRPDNSAS
jgi:hypothetical protein